MDRSEIVDICEQHVLDLPKVSFLSLMISKVVSTWFIGTRKMVKHGFYACLFAMIEHLNTFEQSYTL